MKRTNLGLRGLGVFLFALAAQAHWATGQKAYLEFRSI